MARKKRKKKRRHIHEMHYFEKLWTISEWTVPLWFQHEFEVAFPLQGIKVQHCVLLRGHSPSFGEEIKLSDIKFSARCYLWFNSWGSGLRSRPLRFISWFCNQLFLWTSTSHLSLCFNFLILRETELREGDLAGCE